MSLSVDVPHKLGAAEARRRIANGTGQLVGRLPAGATAKPTWVGRPAPARHLWRSARR
jgi:hypothetical protein